MKIKNKKLNDNLSEANRNTSLLVKLIKIICLRYIALKTSSTLTHKNTVIEYLVKIDDNFINCRVNLELVSNVHLVEVKL